MQVTCFLCVRSSAGRLSPFEATVQAAVWHTTCDCRSDTFPPCLTEDMESEKCPLSAIIVRDLAAKVSNYRASQTLDEYLKAQVGQNSKPWSHLPGCWTRPHVTQCSLALQQKHSSVYLTMLELMSCISSYLAYLLATNRGSNI